MKPTIGRIVILFLTDEQKQKLGGNHVTAPATSKTAPAMIVAVWGDEPTSAVNLKVMGDSENNIWVTSATQGDQPGQWSWPVISK